MKWRPSQITYTQKSINSTIARTQLLCIVKLIFRPNKDNLSISHFNIVPHVLTSDLMLSEGFLISDSDTLGLIRPPGTL